MAAYESDGGGIGGKFRKRLFRRAPATPYDRPQAAARPAQPLPAEPRGNGWLSRLVDPATRIISWSASRLFPSSVFQKRLGAPPAAPPEANQRPVEEVIKEPSTNSLHEVQEHLSDGKNAVNSSNAGSAQHGTSSHVDGVFELEQLLKQKTFTRTEFDHLTQLLHSRIVEPNAREVAVNSENIEITNVRGQTNNAVEVNVLQPASSYEIEMPTIPGEANKKQQCANDVSQPMSSFNNKDKRVASEHERRERTKEEAASSTKIAKIHMSSRFFKSSASLSVQNKLFRDDRAMPIGTPYARKPSNHSLVLRTAVRNSEPVETRRNSLLSSGIYGRSAIYKMSRSPYFKPCSMANLGGDRSSLDDYGCPSMSENITHSGGRQTFKRGRSLLEDDIGSSGPTRRTHQKSNLMSPLASPYLSRGNSLPSSSTRVDQGSVTLNQKLLHLNEQENDHSEFQTVENSGVPSVPLPPQSSEMARKILQQPDKLVTSPKGQSSNLKIDMEESPFLLTHNMLHGQALKSMEEIDMSKFLNVQKNGSLKSPSDSHQKSFGNTISQKQDKSEENGSTKSAVKGVRFASTNSVLEKPNNVSGREAKPSTTTAHFVVSGAATTTSQKKPSFQMSAPEDLVELDDDSDDIKDSPSTATIVGNKPLLISKCEITHEKPKLEKSMKSSSNNICTSMGVSNGDSTKISNGLAPQCEETPAPTFKADLVELASGSASTAAGASGLGFSNATTATVLEGSKGEVVQTSKGGDLFNAFGNAALPTLSGFGAFRTSELNDGITSSTAISSALVAPSMTLGASFAPGFSTSTSMAPNSSATISSDAPIFSTIPSFQFGASGSFGASNAVTSSTEKSESTNLVGESVKSSVFSVSSSAPLLGTSAAFSSTRSNSSAVLTPSIFASTSNGSSALPAPALFSTATGGSSAMSLSSGFSTSTSMAPSSAATISSAAPILSTIPSFQFGASGSFGGASTVTSSTEKSDSTNLVGEPVKSSAFSVSSSAPLGTSAALSNTRSNSSAVLTPSIFASTSNSSSALPAPALFSTATGSSAVSMLPGFSTSSNGFSGFGSSPQSGGANSLFSSNSSQNLTVFGTTAESSFSTQPAQSGTGMSHALPISSSNTFGSSIPTTMFGLSGTSSSGSASSSFGFSTPGLEPLGSSSGFSFPTATGSSSSSGSSSTIPPAKSFVSSTGLSTISTLSAGGSSSSHVWSTPFGSSGFSFAASAISSANSSGNLSLVAGTGTGLFKSTSHSAQSSPSGSIFASTTFSPATGLPFGSAPSSGSSPFMFGSSSGSVSSFTSVGSTTSLISLVQPVFGAPNQTSGLNSGSPGNDQMNVEDSMADDSVQSSVLPAVKFGQPTNTPASPNFVFGSPATPGGTTTFQFGSQQNNFMPQSPSPFQPAGNLEFAAGGSFSLGSSGGGDTSGRRTVKVRRDKHRKR
uniref:Nuclear pore complex protein NUP1 n=1 Tax=Musa acuminata subsp. malaccensis TaxID=214687 RepID=A0A804IGQ0_MUSAM|nr:PREDICTED: nuclear pore complex protein NUP1-like [Musa acuminata subsp. malaccensis]